MELTRSKYLLTVCFCGRKEGILSVHPAGNNVFASQFERVLPASSVADLYPLNYSGKTDESGFMLEEISTGTNILVDFDKHAEIRQTAISLSWQQLGQGKSYLMKLLLCNQRESGNTMCLDPEHEYEDCAITLAAHTLI